MTVRGKKYKVFDSNTVLKAYVDKNRHHHHHLHHLLLPWPFMCGEPTRFIKESRLYTAKEYVDKLVSVLQANNVQLSNVDVCFVATDDASVVPEMQSALEATQLSCRLVYTPTANITGKGDRYRPNSTLIFLAELSMLVEATYFVGTFNSNVGELAAVLRACPGGYPAENHFAQSYGVDQEDWMLH